MSGTRALFASIGASVLLVAAAALSLLAVSAVFAFGGWSDPVAASSRQPALVLASSAAADRQTDRKSLVLPARPAADRRAVAQQGAAVPPPGRARAADQAAITPVPNRPAKAAYNPPPVHTTTDGEDVAPKPAPAPKSAGDGVRSAGEGLSGTVQSTGDALAQLTDPLLPPVTAATQKVLNVVAELLRRATDGLGRTVDTVLPAQ